MEPPAEDSGSTPPSFLSSVVPASATFVVTATCAGVVTVSVGRPGARLAEQVEPEHLGEDPLHHRVQHADRDGPVLDGGLQRRAVVGVERLLLVGALHRPLGGVQRPVVRHHEAGEAPLIAQDGGLQVGVVAGEVAVDHRVRAHDRGVARLHRRVERRQVDLVLGPGVDDHVVGGRVPVRLLVVHREVLHLGLHVLALHAGDLGHGERGVQGGILAQRLERPAPARVPVDVHRRAEVGAGPLAVLLGPDHLAVLLAPATGPRPPPAPRRPAAG